MFAGIATMASSFMELGTVFLTFPLPRLVVQDTAPLEHRAGLVACILQRLLQ